jgi:hypothetical protein
MGNYELLRQAVRRKKQVFALYDGRSREFCPHLLGLKNGEPNCLVYQFGGVSSKPLAADGSPANWRCLVVARLSNLSIRDGAWHTGIANRALQTCVDLVDSEAR